MYVTKRPKWHTNKATCIHLSRFLHLYTTLFMLSTMSISESEFMDAAALNSDRKQNTKEVFELFTVKPSSSHGSLQSKNKNISGSNISVSNSQETSDLSDEVFIKSETKPRPVSTSSKSEMKSYRDKINERFKIIKEKAGKSSKRANIFKETAEKIMLEKIRRESCDIDAEFELMRNRFKLGKCAGSSESYNFFCQDKQSEENPVIEESQSKSTDKLAKIDLDAIEFIYPKAIRSNLNQEDFLFKPKAHPVDILDKLEDEYPRCLEDEGLFVPKFPNIPSRSLLILEQRLSKDSKKWFNCEGTLDIMQDPIESTSFRTSLQPLSSKTNTIYVPGKVEPTDCEEVAITSENVIQFEISFLKFMHHPLFSKEHVFERKLRNLFDEHKANVDKNTLNRLNCRLEALRNLLKKSDETIQSEENSDQEDDKTNVYKREIYSLREMIFDEGKKERNRIKDILNIWRMIKKIREANNYSNTTIKLIVYKQKTDFQLDKQQYVANFEAFFNEILDEHTRSNEEELRSDLMKRYQESFRQPGEPILQFSINDDNPVTKIIGDSKEIARRNAVSSTKLYLRVICNKVEVCKTKSLILNSDFTCNFNENIYIQLVNIPKYLNLEIIEQPKSLGNKTVALLNIKLPVKGVAFNNKKCIKEIFEKIETVSYKHSGVGSGLNLHSLMKDCNNGAKIISDCQLNTCGMVTVTTTWNNIGSHANSIEHYDEIDLVNKIIDKNGAINLDHFSKWMHTKRPDPQDPKNSILYEFYLPSNEQEMLPNEPKKFFRLSPYMEKLQFCSTTVLDENIRLTLLQLRDKNEPEFDGMIIPNRVKEIPLSIIEDYKKRIQQEAEETFTQEDDDDDEIQIKRIRGRRMLKESHIKILQKCKSTHSNLTFEDVVDEKILHYFETLIRRLAVSFINWFRWRPLSTPLPEGRKFFQNSTLSEDFQIRHQTKIILKIISAINLPQPNDDNDELNPYVEVQFNNINVRTTTSKGLKPIWNEYLSLPLEFSHNDFLNPNSLNGAIVVNIFDEKPNVLTKFDRVKSKRWLGSLELPLATVCSYQLEGMFKVKLPSLLIGYNKDETSKSPRLNIPQNSQTTYLNISATVQPNVPKLSHNIEELPCNEVPYLKDHCLKWNENYNANYPQRKFSILAIDTKGTTVCVVRYIRPLEPPQINVEGFDVTPEQCLRYISLIPFTECNPFYQNIWLSVDQFLSFMIGTVVDHAIALTCYLLALKVEAWLLLGFGIPYGSTAFVLVKEYDNNHAAIYCIYDVVAGGKIYLTDVFCPLATIYCIINDQNVWANVQRNYNLSIMRFDLTRRSDWLPLFDDKLPAPTTSVHGKIVYTPMMKTDQLELKLDRQIRKRIYKLRQLDHTVWNHHVSNVFKSVLSSYEDYMMYGKNNQEALKKLRECMTTFKIEGHIYNSPFSSISDLVKKVKSFGVHLEEDHNIQFASAVFIKSYPNQVLTVWIFIASVKEKPTEIMS